MSLDRITLTMPTCNSPANVWIDWHKQCKKRYGKKDANRLFMALWDKRTEDGTFLSDDANTSQLRDYMKSQGVTIEGAVLSDVGDFFGDIFGFFGTIGKTYLYIMLVVVVLIIIAVMMVVFKAIKDPSYAGKVGGAVVSARTGGMSSKALR